jgi:hypothetical protein
MHGSQDSPVRGLRSRIHALCFLLLSVTILLSGVVTSQSQEPPKPSRFEIGLIGDVPYSDDQVPKFSNLLQELNNANLAFVVHVGDFKAGDTLCSDEIFAHRKGLFQTSKHPFIYLPGDNEWTECHRDSAGFYDPPERLAKLREMFLPGDRSLGQRTLRLTRQSNDSRYAKFRENVRWTYGGVLFVGLHLVGENNNLGREPEADAEYAERNAANLVWLKQAFELAKRPSYKGLMILMQANPYFEDRWRSLPVRLMRITPPDPKPSGYSDFLTALEREVLAFDKPVVLVHGDTHYFRIDKPLFSPLSELLVVEHFTRVETFGSPNVHWVRAIVDPNDPQVFTFKPEIVKKNLAKHK